MIEFEIYILLNYLASTCRVRVEGWRSEEISAPSLSVNLTSICESVCSCELNSRWYITLNTSWKWNPTCCPTLSLNPTGTRESVLCEILLVLELIGNEGEDI